MRSMVEAGRVELPSENPSMETSPGADGYCGSLALPVPVTLGKPSRQGSGELHDSWPAQSFAGARAPLNDAPFRLVPSGRDGHGLSRDKLNVIVVL